VEEILSCCPVYQATKGKMCSAEAVEQTIYLAVEIMINFTVAVAMTFLMAAKALTCVKAAKD